MAQRIRIIFRKGGVLQWVSHLDVMRTWERALRRAKLPLAYTQGFSPHPRIALASPLPVGFEGERELMDVWFEPPLAPSEVSARLMLTLPPGLGLVDIDEVAERLPSLQSSLRAARYRITFDTSEVDLATLRERLEDFLALESLEWEERRGEKTRIVDLRPGVLEAVVREEQPADENSAGEILAALELRLSLEEGRGIRAASVVDGLRVGVEPLSMVRTELEIDRPQIALAAWRARSYHEE